MPPFPSTQLVLINKQTNPALGKGLHPSIPPGSAFTYPLPSAQSSWGASLKQVVPRRSQTLSVPAGGLWSLRKRARRRVQSQWKRGIWALLSRWNLVSWGLIWCSHWSRWRRLRQTRWAPSSEAFSAEFPTPHHSVPGMVQPLLLRRCSLSGAPLCSIARFSLAPVGLS